MKHLLIIAVHLSATIANLARPGGVRATVTESLLLKHVLRTRKIAHGDGAPHLNSFDRLLLGGVIALAIARQGMLMRRVGARP